MSITTALVVNHYRTLTFCFINAIIGFISWNGDTSALLLLPLVVLIWRCSRSPLAAFFALFAYYASASRGMLYGASIFFSEPTIEPAWWVGIVLWVVSSAILAATWAIGYGKTQQGLRLVFIIGALSFPPIGLIGWANPLTAAGVYFPGFGWYGLAAMLFLLICIAQVPRPSLLVSFLAVTGTAHAFHQSPAGSASWVAINTHLGGKQDISSEFQKMKTLQSIILEHSAVSNPGTVFVLPELVGGNWSLNQIWWEDVEATLREKNQSALLGVHTPAANGKYLNGMVGLGQADGMMIDRVPVPLAMWKPYASDGAVAGWFAPGTAIVAGKRVAHIICYEQLLVWPVLISAMDSPDLIVAASNMWWAKSTSVPAIQRQAIDAWAMLFNLPVVASSNT